MEFTRRHLGPFYNKEDFNTGFDINTKASEFRICQNIFVHGLEKLNLRAIDSINRGAESLHVTIENVSSDVALLKNFPLKETTIYFNLTFL